MARKLAKVCCAGTSLLSIPTSLNCKAECTCFVVRQLDAIRTTGQPRYVRGAGPILAPGLYSIGTLMDFRVTLPVSTNSMTRCETCRAKTFEFDW